MSIWRIRLRLQARQKGEGPRLETAYSSANALFFMVVSDGDNDTCVLRLQ